MKSIITILKKELKRFFTDKRTLFAMFAPAIILFIMYSVMGNIITTSIMESQEKTEFKVYLENEPEELKAFLSSQPEWTVTYIEDQTKEELFDLLKNKELDLLVFYEEDFINKVNSYDPSSGLKAPDVEIYYNSSNDASNVVFSYYVGCLNSFESTISNKFDVNASVDKVFDVATKEDTTVQFLTMLMPFLLVLMLFTGTMSFCSESIAGEKERGTIATLLATPTKRYELAIGKILSLGIVSLTSAVATSFGLFASLPKLAGNSSLTLSVYGLGSILMVFIIIVLTVLLFTTILAIISTYAKSVKEASALSMPVMIIVMACSMLNMMSTKATDIWWAYLIPIYNSVQCFTGIFSLNINLGYWCLTIISNLCFIGLGVFVLTKLFNSEKIMFNK